MTQSAHLDTFAADGLPPRADWPDLLFTLEALQYPQRLNCAARLLDRHIADGNGDRRCILAPGTAWTYGDLLVTANRIAHVLVDDMGLVPGNRVLLRAPNTPMLAAAWLAVMKAGGIAVTTMPLYRAGELQQMIEKAQVHRALCDVRLLDDLRVAAKEVPDFQTLSFGDGELEARMSGKPLLFQNVDTAADDVAIVAFTSGTTGKPKAALHTHRDILACCDTYGSCVLAPKATDLFAGSPPLGFTFGLGGLLLFPLHCGAAVLLLEKPAAEPLLQAIQAFQVTTVFTAPLAYRTMAELVERYDLRSLHTCVSAGETLPRPIWDLWQKRTGLKILDGIGSTEMLHIFIGSPERDVRAGSTGRVVPGYVAEIHDENGESVPRGTIGRLAVKGPTGCTYLADDRQRHYVRNGWNYPGDAYRMDADGYFWYVARTDDMIVSAGFNVSGPEVEEAIIAHAMVKECAVVGKPDPAHHTSIVKAYVVLTDGVAESAAVREELLEFVKARIAPYKCPREVAFVAELPRTQTGKVQRFRLREKAASD